MKTILDKRVKPDVPTKVTATRTVKVDNKQIARAVFFKLYHHLSTAVADKKLLDNAALRLASGIFQETLTLWVDDRDHLIEAELKKFGCKLQISSRGSFASFNFNGQTEIEAEKWQKLCGEIYDGVPVQKTPVEMKSKNETTTATQSKEIGVIGFLEKYLPNFYSSDDVARWNDLTKYLDFEMTMKEQGETGLYDTHYHQAFFEYEEVQNKLFEKAFNAYTQGKQSLRLDELIKNYFGSSNEDRKKLDYLDDILSSNRLSEQIRHNDYSVFREYLKVTDKLFNAAIQEREKITAQKSKPSPILEQIMNATAGQHKQQPTESHSIRERSKHKM